jgi:hypothetical protein
MQRNVRNLLWCVGALAREATILAIAVCCSEAAVQMLLICEIVNRP